MAADITPEIAHELAEALLNHLRTLLPKYGLTNKRADIFTEVMQPIIEDWSDAGGDVILVDLLERNSPILERLQDWSQRTGCEIEEAAYKVLAKHVAFELPTVEEEAEFKARYAKAQAGVQAQQSLEDLPPLPEKDWLN